MSFPIKLSRWNILGGHDKATIQHLHTALSALYLIDKTVTDILREPKLAQHNEQAESGAEIVELSDSELVLGKAQMVFEDETGKWEPEQRFSPPPKPPNKRGEKPIGTRGKSALERPVQSDVSDLRPNSHSAASRNPGQKFEAEAEAQISFLIQGRHPNCKDWLVPRGLTGL